MICDPVLGEVVRADALTAVDRAHLRLARGRGLRFLALDLHLTQPRLEHAQRGLLVLQLRLLVLAADDDTRRQVGDAHGRVGRVDTLPTRAGAAIDVDLEVVRAELDLVVVLVEIRHDEDARRARVDAALTLGDGHALHAVHAAFVLEARPRGLARFGQPLRADRDAGVFVPAEIGVGRVGNLGLPTAAFRVTQVHADEVAGEQRRLGAALAGLDLEDDIALIVLVARQQERAQFVGARLQMGLQRRQLRGERGVLVGQLFCRTEVVLRALPGVISGDGRCEGRVTLVEAAHQRRVRMRRRFGQLLLEIVVLGDDRGGGIKHDAPRGLR